jgi:hypothetical protein
VVLACAYLNHDVTGTRDENLTAMCQLNHDRHDAAYRAANRKRKRIALTMEAARRIRFLPSGGDIIQLIKEPVSLPQAHPHR